MSFVVVQTRFQLFISILSYVLLGNDISLRKVKKKNDINLILIYGKAKWYNS